MHKMEHLPRRFRILNHNELTPPPTHANKRRSDGGTANYDAGSPGALLTHGSSSVNETDCIRAPLRQIADRV
jgi:hypothetical protein